MGDKVILLVEDNADDELLAIRAFRQNHIGNEIVVARDGAEALDWLFSRGLYADRAPGLPQVVLLDLNLPKVGGHQVLKEIRGHPKTTGLPVAVLTSSPDDQERVESYDHGANRYLRKPIDFEEFVAAVRELGVESLVPDSPNR